MLGIEFPELVVCIIVALMVIGPQRLPEMVRTLSLWVGRFKRSLRETKDNIEQQLGVEEIRRQLHSEEMMRTLADMQEEIETALNYEMMGHQPVPQLTTQTKAERLINESTLANSIEQVVVTKDEKSTTSRAASQTSTQHLMADIARGPRSHY